jgi:PhnB protein
MAVKAIPEGFHTLTPYIEIENAGEAIEFYKRAFGAREKARMDAPGGKIGHAELEIGDSLLMLADRFPQSSISTPKDLGGTTVNLFMYVEDADAVVQQAVDAGATLTRPVENKFWGDRFGIVSDPYGHAWSIGTHVEDVASDEMQERGKAAMAAMSSLDLESK